MGNIPANWSHLGSVIPMLGTLDSGDESWMQSLYFVFCLVCVPYSIPLEILL